MDFSSFSHGQIHSKVWLCEQIEPFLRPKSKIIILGCWHNVLGIILMVRNPHSNFIIKGIDIDTEAIKVADNLTEAWRFEEFNPFHNEVADANTFDYSDYDIIINCSVEHMESLDWFNRIPNGKLVCIQSMSIGLVNDPIYKITNPNTSLEIFKNKFSISQTYILSEKKFNYEINPYSRFCLIGIK